MVKITNIVSGYLGTNTYFIYREGETDCIVIDPANAESALKKCRELGVECKYILLTHGHFDHVLGVSKLKDSTGAAIYIHEADAAALYDTKVSLGAMVGASHEPCTADFIVNDGDVLKLGSITLQVIATPGHTKGGVCYLFEEERTIFSGDTLFRLSVGRDDLPGGDGDEHDHKRRDEHLQRDFAALAGFFVLFQPGCHAFPFKLVDVATKQTALC